MEEVGHTGAIRLYLFMTLDKATVNPSKFQWTGLIQLSNCLLP